ncbi:Glucosamine-1-phosphate N-acetyltransferase / UDP-N-acetylglucosamine pyrophosphorylase [Alphaproteobacteria bacterium]
MLKQYINILVMVLAAGHGKRMHSTLPKVMHKLAGQPLLEYSLQLITTLSSSFTQVQNYKVRFKNMVVVSSELLQNQEFQILLQKYHYCIESMNELQTVLQKHRGGTGHAVLCALKAHSEHKNNTLQTYSVEDTDYVLVLYGDAPLLPIETIEEMIRKILSGRNRTAAVNIGFIADDPTGYGRMCTNAKNDITSIIEEQDTIDTEKQINLCNAGIMLSHYQLLYDFLKLKHNEKENFISYELRLTDFITHITKMGYQCKYVLVEQQKCLGVNTRSQLAELENVMQNFLRNKMLNNGVTMIAPETIFLSCDTVIECDVIIYPYVCILPRVKIGACSNIFSFSHIAGVVIGENVSIGPFARIRPDSNIADQCHIGNFVEVKNANLSHSVKASHLSYIGDANIEENSNIGAGTVFCNFDGKNKHSSTVSANSFIGANSTIISPISIGKNSKIAAGSIITDNVPDDNLAIARSKQVNKNKKK